MWGQGFSASVLLSCEAASCCCACQGAPSVPREMLSPLPGPLATRCQQQLYHPKRWAHGGQWPLGAVQGCFSQPSWKSLLWSQRLTVVPLPAAAEEGEMGRGLLEMQGLVSDLIFTKWKLEERLWRGEKSMGSGFRGGRSNTPFEQASRLFLSTFKLESLFYS